MKKIIFLLLSAVTTLTALAENAFVPGSQWYVSARIPGPEQGQETINKFVYELGYVQEMAGKDAMPLYCSVNDADSKLTTYFASEGEKVFFLSDNEWYLAYDFGLAEGESCIVYDIENPSISAEITAVGTALENGSEALTFNAIDLSSPNHQSHEARWITGVGSPLSPVENLYFMMAGPEINLEKMVNGNKVYYQSASAGIQAVETEDAPDAPSAIYTLSGLRMTSAATPGLYLVKKGSTVTKTLIR